MEQVCDLILIILCICNSMVKRPCGIKRIPTNFPDFGPNGVRELKKNFNQIEGGCHNYGGSTDFGVNFSWTTISGTTFFVVQKISDVNNVGGQMFWGVKTEMT